ncbi:MAG: membrane dipeptidase [Anaerolineae bacterium]|nr:membrane dipeptidase [Anaerolineae bacterium]MDW8069351.1 membrane dipeptidase [Anaerolineae bacterium]
MAIRIIVDAHEDIAWAGLALGRDYLRSAWETRRLEEGTEVVRRNGQCMLGLPEWLAGRIALICGSIFVAPRTAEVGGWDPQSYADAEEAFRRACEQMDYYERLAERSERIGLVGSQADLEGVLASWDSDSPQVGILPALEGADPIRRPEDVEYWWKRGVRLVGLAWAAGSRYAGGNRAPGPLTDAGRALLEVLAESGMIMDVSHLAEEAFWEIIDRYEGPIVATHANPRARVPGPRQLSDRMIRALAARDGVVGVVPYNRFLVPEWSPADGKAAATLQDVAAAIDHVCQVVGDADHVGLGSDFDGGFGAEAAPLGIDTVADLPKIADALAERGFTESDIAAVMAENWLRVLRAALP